MSSKEFKFALLGLALAASSAVAAPVVTFSRSTQVRTQTQGGGTYQVLDLFYSNSAGAEFLGYQLNVTTTAGTLFDPARGQDDRQTETDPGTEDFETRGAVDTWVNTVATATAKIDYGYVPNIVSNPAGYNMTGGSQTVPAAPFTFLDVFVNDSVAGDDNDMSNHPDGPFVGSAPYHIARILAAPFATGTIRFQTSDSSAPGTLSDFNYFFGFDGEHQPVVDPEPPESKYHAG
jgi:hypothetical protein